MGRGRNAGDWARFFAAVHDPLLNAWVEEVVARQAALPVPVPVPRAQHRRIISAALRTFARALDRGFVPTAHRRIERALLKDDYLRAFPLSDIGAGYRIFLRLASAEVDRFFSRRSAERRAAMCQQLADVVFENFARVATTRVQLETDALQDSESRFRTMIEAAGDAIALADAATGRVQYANAQAGAMFRTAPETLVGLGIDELVPKRLRPRTQRRLAEAMLRPPGPPRTVRLRLLRTTGEPFDAVISVVRLDRHGAESQYLVVMRDETADKAKSTALRAYSRQLKRIDEIGRALTATFDLDEILRRIVENAREVVPCGAASLLLVRDGRLVFHEALGPKGHVVKQFALDEGQGIAGWVVAHGESVTVPDAHRDARFDPRIEDAVKFPVRSVLCVPLRTQERVLGAIELLNRRGGPFTRVDRELAESFAAFAAIALDKAMLFEERAALREQLLQAEAATHAGRLASTIAQEMIDPLTILKNHAAIFSRDPEAVTPDSLRLVREELDRLHGIIRLLVDYSNSTAERVRPTPLDLLLGDVVATLRPELEAAGVELQIEEPKALPLVEAVPAQVSVTLANLIRHAIHVTPSGAAVHVRVRRRGDEVHVAVRDDGAPLSSQQIQTLVDPTAVQRGVLAKGLDLYIASALVRHHGGELRGRGHRATGTTFSFSLPVASGEEPAWLTL